MFPFRSFCFPTALPVRYSGGMDVPAFLRFAPVPVRARRDGWTPTLQRRFILNLARGMGPTEAARRVGRSRQTAYALLEKPGAGPFAAAWDAAVDFARCARVAARGPLDFTGTGIDTLLIPRFYRGRLVGFVQREDTAAAMRRLSMLDRLAERLAAFDPDNPEWDELVDSVAAGKDWEAVKADAMRLANAPPASACDRLGLRPRSV